MRPLGNFIAAVLWHGGRRFLVITVPALLLTGTLWLVRELGLPPSHPLVMFVRSPWAWPIVILGALLVAAYMAWHEQFMRVNELSRQPALMVQMAKFDNFALIVHNPSDRAAVNITADRIRIPIPQVIQDSHRELRYEAAIPGIPVDADDTEWLIVFDRVDSSFGESMYERLDYRIEGVSIVYQDMF